MEYIKEVTEEIFNDWLNMGMKLWPEYSSDDLKEVFKTIFSSNKETAFLYECENKYIGFINVSIRHEYVEGSNSSPVGYVEGIYVEPEYRKRDIARELLKKGEKWSKDKGCKQMGSDIELHNTNSYKFHTQVGFTEANRLICFIKDL